MTGKRSEATLSPLQRIAVISDVVVPAGIEPSRGAPVRSAALLALDVVDWAGHATA